ncbi:MAG: zinc ribbon domain-containing protein [Deltaproteobacteria bacterium]|jgi:putative FmdB family regulatory protein|nr:zinc ribbon domain-containing protein [Deltaproteobacteria bacterium]
MPVYEYKCHDCGIIFETRQKFSDPPLGQCTECGGSVEKIISLGGFALKGGGWHQQGYGGHEKPAACATPGKSAGCAGCPAAANE